MRFTERRQWKGIMKQKENQVTSRTGTVYFVIGLDNKNPSEVGIYQ